MKIAWIIFYMLSLSRLNAATYYIDFAASNDSANGTTKSTPWKRAPGMPSFAGTYSHSAGDVFIFKGNTTWTSAAYPWTVANSGSSGNPDIYTSDITWFAGVAWSQPVFDAQGTTPSGGMLNALNKSYLTFDNLSFTNYGTTGNQTGINAIDLEACQGLTFSNLTLSLYSQRAFYVHFQTVATFSNFIFRNIDCSHSASMLWFATTDSTATVMTNLTIDGCWVHDGSSQIGGTSPSETHSDGMLHTFGDTAIISGLVVSNNLVSGDWRASFGTAGGVTNFCSIEKGATGKIFNNIIVPSPTQAGMAESWLGGSVKTGQTLEFYNNVMWCTGTNPASGGFLFYCSTGGTVIFKNNIVMGFQYSLNYQDISGSITSDHNVVVSSSGQVYNGSFLSYTQWQALGFDAHSAFGTDATFVSAPSNMMLASGSNAIGLGENLSSTFTNGIASGATFPSPATSLRATIWDAGPYVYTTASPNGRSSLLGNVAIKGSAVIK